MWSLFQTRSASLRMGDTILMYSVDYGRLEWQKMILEYEKVLEVGKPNALNVILQDLV